MQPTIAMNFAEYVVWILLCKHCKFGEKIYYDSRDIEFFLEVYFLHALKSQWCIWTSYVVFPVRHTWSCNIGMH